MGWNAPSDNRDPLANHGRYRTIKWLNKGAFGFVLLAQDQQKGEQVAIKFVQRGPQIKERVEREILNHKSLKHGHVIQLKHVFLTDQYLAISMEYANGGNLAEYLEQHSRLNEALARWIFQQLVIGLDYIHRMKLCSRDIKPKNVLLNTDPLPIVRICDFGFCKHETADGSPKTQLGTLPYMAPEVIFIDGEQAYDGRKVDIWACGAILFKMITGRSFYKGNADSMEAYRQLIEERIARLETLPFSHQISPECKDLLRRILILDPVRRSSIEAIQTHPWFRKDLPNGALQYNCELEEQHVQSEEELRQIIHSAKEIE